MNLSLFRGSSSYRLILIALLIAGALVFFLIRTLVLVRAVVDPRKESVIVSQTIRYQANRSLVEQLTQLVNAAQPSYQQALAQLFPPMVNDQTIDRLAGLFQLHAPLPFELISIERSPATTEKNLLATSVRLSLQVSQSEVLPLLRFLQQHSLGAGFVDSPAQETWPFYRVMQVQLSSPLAKIKQQEQPNTIRQKALLHVTLNLYHKQT